MAVLAVIHLLPLDQNARNLLDWNAETVLEVKPGLRIQPVARRTAITQYRRADRRGKGVLALRLRDDGGGLHGEKFRTEIDETELIVTHFDHRSPRICLCRIDRNEA